HFGRDVEDPAQAEQRVGTDPRRIFEADLELALQHVVDGRPGIREIVEEVAHTTAHFLRYDVGVGRGDRHENLAIEIFVEVEDLAVPVLPRIEPLARTALRGLDGGATAQDHRQDTDEDRRPAPIRRACHFFAPLAATAAGAALPASAALLNRNWLIRLSST